MKIDYALAYMNNFRNDAQKAVEFFLTKDEKQVLTGEGIFVIYPQALNPFLKIMETLNLTKRLAIIPGFQKEKDSVNKPAYIIVKLPETLCVSDLVLDING